MKALWLAVLLLGTQGQQQTPAQKPDSTNATFRNADIGLTFDYPKSWKIAEKKTKKNSWWEFEIASKNGTAHIEVFGLYFRAEKEIFQISQSHAVKQMNAELVRQWDEEILGAPLLLTQSKKDKNQTLVGLVYSFTASKLLFRITAPEAAFEDTLYEWRQALQSLRTLDGQILRPEDPTKLLPGETPFLGPSTVRIGGVPNRFADTVKNEVGPTVQIPAKVESRPIILSVPEGWEGKANEAGNVVELSNAKFPGKIEVRLYTMLAGEPPARALLTQSLATLNQFDAVSKRTEPAPSKNKAGAMYSFIWREGTTKEGKTLTALDSAGQVDQYYWLLGFQSEKLDKEAREQLQGLIDRMFLIVGL